MKRALVTLLLAACGVDYAPADLTLHPIREHSGSRLAIEWWETADGQLSVRGVFDRQLEQECTIRAVRGAYFCLPADATSPLDRYARVTHDVEHADARIVPTSFCSADGLVLADAFHDTVSDVDCSGEECGLALEFERDTTRLLPGYYVGDGLRAPVPMFYDKHLGQTCQFTPAAAGALCTPAGPADPSELVAAFPTMD
jgi:hypothetical protein